MFDFAVVVLGVRAPFPVRSCVIADKGCTSPAPLTCMADPLAAPSSYTEIGFL